VNRAARVKRRHVEALILAEVESEILSGDAVAQTQKAFREELSRLSKSEKSELPQVSQKIAKLKAEEDELRQMLKDGKFSAIALQAAISANGRARAELASSAARSDRKASADVIRMIPESAKALSRSRARSQRNTYRACRATGSTRTHH